MLALIICDRSLVRRFPLPALVLGAGQMDEALRGLSVGPIGGSLLAGQLGACAGLGN